MTPLPIDDYLPAICQALAPGNTDAKSGSLVLIAEPGAGKTTRVAPALLQAGLTDPAHPNIVLLQPRRVAARAVAQRIAQENGWTLGQQVGYHVRFERRLTEATRLRVLTEGILTRQLLDDPFLDRTGIIILDEFHERSIHTDLALALVKEIQQSVRPDLKIIVMSATLDAEPVAAYLGTVAPSATVAPGESPGLKGSEAIQTVPIIRVPGRTHPVTITHIPAPIEPKLLPEKIAACLERLLTAPPHASDQGDYLIFLPGVEEIHRTLRRLEPLAAPHGLLLLPLHGSLPLEDQMRALDPAPSNRRKVILATNIAETSLTIDGVTTVIDSGLARIAGYDARRGLDRLELKRISLASATQRAGRAGRTAPGRCLRLWTQSQEKHLDAHELPEIRRIDLAATVLTLHAWGKPDPRRFDWLDPPPEPALAAAENLLSMLGALDQPQNGAITPLGKRMLALPVHPRLARLLVAAADHGLVEEGATLAALLSEKDLVARPPRAAPGGPGGVAAGGAGIGAGYKLQGNSDLLWRRDLLRQAQAANFAPYLREPAAGGIDPHAARHIARTRDDLLRNARQIARTGAPAPSDSETLLLKITLLAYPDRIVRRRANNPNAGIMVGGAGVQMGTESIVRQGEFLIALDAWHPPHNPHNPAQEATIRMASLIDPAWLPELFPHQMRRVYDVTYDPAADRVIPRAQLFYRDLLLEEDRHGKLDPQQAAAALLEAVRPRIVEIFTAHKTAGGGGGGAGNLLARVAILRQALPEHSPPWPTLDTDQLCTALAHSGILQNKRSLAELQTAPLADVLRSLLPYPLGRQLDELAPEAITVPTGNRIRIDYTVDPPVLAVRLQEMFGQTDTPRIAAGRLPLLLHLLAPNYRPVQITTDLRSFWAHAYFQTRKDLRIRYPKHAWPEDPLTAPPVAKDRPAKR